VVDRVDIGLLNITDATGLQRLNETITELSDAIEEGLTGTVDSCHYAVMSMRQCTSSDDIISGCTNGRVLVTGQPDFNGSYSISLRLLVTMAFWATACKTVCPMLSDGCPVLSCPVLSCAVLSCLSVCLSVTLVYFGKTVGWIKMKLGKGVGLLPGNIVLDEDPAPSPKGAQPSNFPPMSVVPNSLMH